MDCRQKGFTLIELMIVILIIAILVAIAVPLYMSIQENARVNSCKGSLRTIDGAVAYYYGSAGGIWPGSGSSGITNLVNGSFLKSIPKCPDGGNTYLLSSNTASCTKSATHKL